MTRPAGRRRLVAALVSGALALSVATTPAGSTAASGGRRASSAPRSLSWLVLGDSYSSGEGVQHTDEGPFGERCAQATGRAGAKAWAVVARERLAAAGTAFAPFAFMACSGKTTDFVDREIEQGGAGPWDMVTFTFGGNNLGFADVLKGCINPIGPQGCDVSEATLRKRIDTLVGRGDVRRDGYAAASTLPEAYAKVAKRTRAGGHVVVLGYPQLVEEPSRWPSANKFLGMCQGIEERDAWMLRGVTGYLNQQIGQAVIDAGRSPEARRRNVQFHFLDVSPVYEPSSGDRHGLCGAGSWINGFAPLHLMTASYHPTQEGYTATGEALAGFVQDQGIRWTTEGIDRGDMDAMTLPADHGCTYAADFPSPTTLSGGSIEVGYGFIELEESILAEVDGDGAGDGIAHLVCSSGAGGTSSIVVAMLAAGRQVIEIPYTDDAKAALPEVDAYRVRSLDAGGGVLTVNTYAHRDDDIGCCPTALVTLRYRLGQGRPTLIDARWSDDDPKAFLDGVIRAWGEGDYAALESMASPEAIGQLRTEFGAAANPGLVWTPDCALVDDDSGTCEALVDGGDGGWALIAILRYSKVDGRLRLDSADFGGDAG